MKVTQYQQGEPCWVELCTHDWQGAKSFYQALFGWGHNDMETPEGYYTTMQIEGDDVAAMYQMPSSYPKDVPTHWTIYFAVADVEATVAKAVSAGGELLAGPHDVGNAGKMALLSDPEGSRFALWQAKEHIGIGQKFVNNSLCWVELACKDTAKASDFYSEVLGYTTKQTDMGEFMYTEWCVAEQSIGGMMQMTEEWGDIPAHWMTYFTVDDCDAMAERVKALGGSVCVPPTDIEQVGRFAVVNDPQGGVFSIIKLLENMNG